MSKPKFDAELLTAVHLGFYGGHLIHPKTQFRFTGDRIPKWAMLPVEADAAIAKLEKRPLTSADTKPLAAQAAVKAKASAG